MSGTQQATEPAVASAQRARHSRGAPRAYLRTPRVQLFLGSSVLIGLWALFQNLYKIGDAPILADEPTYIIAAQRYLTGNLWAPRSPKAANYLGATPDNFEHPPLVKYIFGVSQWIDGNPLSLDAPRVMSALATLVAAFLVAVWVGRIAGRWTGLLAAALLTVIPEACIGSPDSLGRFDRFAMLDPVAGAFMVVSVIVTWVWAHRTGRAGWLWAAGTGVAVGLASGSKENGFLGAIGPVLLVVVLALLTRNRREILVRIGQALLAGVLSLVTFASLYIPFPHPIARIRYLINFQTAQSSGGHLIGFDGRVTAFPPWWANFWFAGHSYGSVLSGFLIVSVLCAVVLRRDRLVAWCVAAMAGPIIFQCFIANVALGYYWVMWTPMVLVLSALGAAEVIRRVASLARPAVPIAILTGIAVLAIPVTESVAQSVTVAELKPTGVMVVPQLMRENNLHGDVVSAGLAEWLWNYYTPKKTVYYTATQPVPDAAIIAIGQPECRQLIDQSVRALVKVNLATGHVKEIYTDSQITAYAVTGSLTLPTTAQIDAEPAGKLTDNC
jgi:4-amino-4-deoxy-L-arabinose transferase-like glycosyltransferase